MALSIANAEIDRELRPGLRPTRLDFFGRSSAETRKGTRKTLEPGIIQGRKRILAFVLSQSGQGPHEPAVKKTSYRTSPGGDALPFQSLQVWHKGSRM